jgi:hypothetical protein
MERTLLNQRKSIVDSCAHAPAGFGKFVAAES